MLDLLHVFSSPISLLPRSRLGEPCLIVRLYLIRTDSVNLSGERVTASAICVNNLFADLYKYLSCLSSIITHENSRPIRAVLRGFSSVLDGFFSRKREASPLNVALQANILLVYKASIEKCLAETEP